MSSEAWVKTLRNAVRTTMGDAGWKVGPSRSSQVFLQKVELVPRGQKARSATVSLPYSWSETCPRCHHWCRAIQKVMAAGVTPEGSQR